MPKARRTILPGSGLLALLLMLPAAGRAAPVDIPLLVDTRIVARVVAQALEIGAAGDGRITADDCNHVELDDLAVAPAEGHLVVSLAVRAVAGAWALGQCRGPSPWQGRMNLELVPGLEPGGLAVAFVPQGIELARSDGSPGPFTGPTRSLAESLILPRLRLVRLDLAERLAAIDGLLESALAGSEATLAERTRIRDIEVLETGLRLHLGLQVDAEPQPAAPKAEPALDPEELVRWQQREDELDGFLTTVLVALAAPATSADLRLELLAVLLDARYALAEALRGEGDAPGGDKESHARPADPVRRVFVESWDRLVPLLAELDAGNVAGPEADLRLAAFMAGGDALRALDALGPEFPLDISSDGLRRLARILLAEDVPERFTPLPLDVDPRLRALFGLKPPGAPESGARLPAVLDFLVPAAAATAESPADALRGQVPRLATLDDYLELVASLLQQKTDEHLSGDSRVPARLMKRFHPLVRATAWKESCWRQFTGPLDSPRVLTSPVGALGMMQVHGRVWRGMYDLGRLAEEVDYNVAAGAEILEHYLVDYAIRRGEHEHPGGDDNLMRATYAAYNGGPSQMGRYRRENTPARLRAIDDEFWRHFQTFTLRDWPDVSSCYPTGP